MFSPDDGPSPTPDWPPLDESGHVDLAQIQCNLLLTKAQRIEQYLQWMEFVEIAREAGAKLHGVVNRPVEAFE